jgi:putative glutamine amidotransferase
MEKRPLIGCSTYHKTVEQHSPLEVYGLTPAYVEAVRAAGGLPVMIPLGLALEELLGILERVDGILLPGGGDVEPARYGGNSADPTLRDVDDDRDWTEVELIRQAVAGDKPLLAICRGHQVFNVALGGTLWEDIGQHMPGAIIHDCYRSNGRDYLAHEVEITAGSCLAQIVGPQSLPVNSLHHQGIRDLAPALRAIALAPDGLIEAVEVPDHPFALGVQWHPEDITQREPRMKRLFQAFVAAAANGSR